jgi:hypothetical protein
MAQNCTKTFSGMSHQNKKELLDFIASQWLHNSIKEQQLDKGIKKLFFA